ncbi:MAG TPA: 16S rRNA (cytosine(967)-C(5))-methyltransferase RsmB [Candidatus Acidoferrum sp.]|nr:16S rRNA (cytosine(967)-C(5))-methyltransferase RsmB [Candidatus Acidoferrum sp.]
MPVSPARTAAFDILLRVERRSSYASELLNSSKYERLSPPDRALATELVMGVLRWRSRLDDEIVTASAQPLQKLDLEVLIALRMAVYQFRWLDRIPQHAALHESVQLVKRARKSSAAGFVNAVLRKLSSAPRSRELEEAASVQVVAQQFAHPLWMVERWAAEYGLDAARKICVYNQSVPRTAVRLRTPSAEAELEKSGISLRPGALLHSARQGSGDIATIPACSTSQVVIQDEGSQLVASLVGSRLPLGTRILDCCAAPGGKTLAIADHNPTASITAVELHPHRVRLLQKLLRAAQAPAEINVILSDIRDLPASSGFDRVLADVPCSGTGTLARNPEIKWRLQPDDLASLQARQIEILRSALAQARPGGRVLYSTCSLEREENEFVVERVLAENPSFRMLDCRTELSRLKDEGELTWPDPANLTRGPYLRTIPGIHQSDGFFAAILERS